MDQVASPRDRVPQIQRSPLGLTKALSDHVYQYLVAVDELGGDKCPGEDECFELKKPGCTAENTCPDCPMLVTKPGEAGQDIQFALITAMKIDERVQSGLTFSDVNALSPFKWAALHGLKQGRARYEEYQDKKAREQTAADQGPTQ